MKNKRHLRIMLFMMSLIALCVAFFVFFNDENKRCLGIKIIEKEDIQNLSVEQNADLLNSIYFCDELAPIDIDNSTIYLPQNITSETKKQDLNGLLKIKDNSYDLYFLEDEFFDNLEYAIENNHNFKLYVINDDNVCVIYNVVFTTLPVIRIDEWSSEIEEDVEIKKGCMTLWPSNNDENDHFKIEHSELEWHIRGNTASRLWKKPYKLNLKDKNGNNKNINMLGMGSDDDWILNAMYVDDSKVREKLFMDLWNDMCKENDYNYQMSNGKYVEVIINGEYCGLYLLQNRVDKKYLRLNDNDILLKGSEVYDFSNGILPYIIKYTNQSDSETMRIVKEMLSDKTFSYYNQENIIDVFLYLQLFSANDNMSFKNMYYVLSHDGKEFLFTLIPWDTDVSLGILWNEELEDYVIDYDLAANIIITRPEIDQLIMDNPNFEYMIAKRWRELNDTYLDKNRIVDKIIELNKEIKQCGAFDRDKNVWGNFRKNDNIESNMIDFVGKRIDWMNERYQISK